MAEVSFATVVQRQVQLLSHICETLTKRALAGTSSDLEALFLAQGHLEHWLQYVSPLAFEPVLPDHEAPPPLPGMRAAPPLPHESDPAYDLADVATEDLRPVRVFPPDPLWVGDLEHDRHEREEDR